MDIHLNQYYDIPLCLMMIYIGCFTLLILAKKRNIAVPPLSYIGRNTLVYFMQGYFLSLTDTAVKLFWPSFNIATWSWSIFKALIACFGCAALSVPINRFVPELVGKKR